MAEPSRGGLDPLNDFALPYPVQFRGSPLARALLRLIGWRFDFAGLPARQGVVIVYPHTSNWDFPVAMLLKWGIGIDLKFWGKDTLFRVPVFGRWLRWLGGVPVQRTGATGAVEQMAALIRAQVERDEYFWLGLAPEGTCKYIPGWRSGFYRLTQLSGVPLGVATLDWGTRTLRCRHFLRLSGDEAADMARIAAICAGARGHRPEQAAPVVILDGTVPRADTIVKR